MFQVKTWFQNRRMKHKKTQKKGEDGEDAPNSPQSPQGGDTTNDSLNASGIAANDMNLHYEDEDSLDNNLREQNHLEEGEVLNLSNTSDHTSRHVTGGVMSVQNNVMNVQSNVMNVVSNVTNVPHEVMLHHRNVRDIRDDVDSEEIDVTS